MRRELQPGAAPFNEPAPLNGGRTAARRDRSLRGHLDGPVDRRLPGGRHRPGGRHAVHLRRHRLRDLPVAMDDDYYATDGHCTHAKTLLCDGLVMDSVIECLPQHNGQFVHTSGKALGTPVLVFIRTYLTKIIDGTVYIEVG